MMNHYDVIIIGTGAGGGTMARALAPTGKRILILEKGGFVPRESVLDPYCRPHELDNVFVTDGSFFVSSGAVNPTLTIIAQTLRVADYIKNQIL